MDTKKYNSQFKYTVQFNNEKHKQNFAIKCLSDKGRKKAAYIAEAIWVYEKYFKNSQFNSDSPSVDIVDECKDSNDCSLDNTVVLEEENESTLDNDITKEPFVVIDSDDNNCQENSESPSTEPVELDTSALMTALPNQDQIKKNLQAWGLDY